MLLSLYVVDRWAIVTIVTYALKTVEYTKIIVLLKYLVSISKFGDGIVCPSYALMQTHNKKRDQLQNMNK